MKKLVEDSAGCIGKDGKSEGLKEIGMREDGAGTENDRVHPQRTTSGSHSNQTNNPDVFMEP